MVHQYQIIDVSWDEKILKGHSHPQSVMIITPLFLECLKKQYNDYSSSGNYLLYYKKLKSIVDNFDCPLSGVLDYKKPLDYMIAYHYRRGMVACVSKKFIACLEKQKVACPSEYFVKPIALNGIDELYYVLFIPMTGLQESSIDFQKSEFYIEDVESPHFKENAHIKDLEDFNKTRYAVPRKLFLHTHSEPKSIYQIESCPHVFISELLVKELLQSNITGLDITPLNDAPCKLYVEDDIL